LSRPRHLRNPLLARVSPLVPTPSRVQMCTLQRRIPSWPYPTPWLGDTSSSPHHTHPFNKTSLVLCICKGKTIQYSQRVCPGDKSKATMMMSFDSQQQCLWCYYNVRRVGEVFDQLVLVATPRLPRRRTAEEGAEERAALAGLGGRVGRCGHGVACGCVSRCQLQLQHSTHQPASCRQHRRS
jgi:hypothetical protein